MPPRLLKARCNALSNSVSVVCLKSDIETTADQLSESFQAGVVDVYFTQKGLSAGTAKTTCNELPMNTIEINNNFTTDFLITILDC